MEEKTFMILSVVIVVVIVLGFVIHGIVEYRREMNEKQNIKFPPFPNKCPDYWEVKKGKGWGGARGLKLNLNLRRSRTPRGTRSAPGSRTSW